jgi:hypothetical protein
VNSEIVVYRKEEWLKVFIHESFHNFGLDFSDMNIKNATNHILDIFPVNSQVNLFESYTEFWAEIINASLCSFLLLKNKNDSKKFISNVTNIIHYERTYSFFQMVKTLRFMGLTYKDIYSGDDASKTLRKTMYKEQTNVLSYYIIKTILMNNYNGFLNWCKTHNLSLIQFNKTPKNLHDFCIFIEKNYKKIDMLENVKNIETFFDEMNNKMDAKMANKYKFLLSNMRMSIFEMG